MLGGELTLCYRGSNDDTAPRCRPLLSTARKTVTRSADTDRVLQGYQAVVFFHYGMARPS